MYRQIPNWIPPPDAGKPEFIGYRRLPANGNLRPLLDEMMANWKARGAQDWLVTIVNPTYPRPPYPDGIYFMGWTKKVRNYPDFQEFPLEAATE